MRIVCFLNMHLMNLCYSHSWNAAKEGDVFSSSPPISQLFPMFRLLSLLSDRVAN